MAEPTPNDDRFNRREANGTPLAAAVDDLCRLNPGYPIARMEQMTLGEIAALARATYGNRLPEFWRIWNDWNQPGLEQPMGDL
jgi:hypothetical protein